DISEYDTLDELKNSLKEKLAEDKKAYAQNARENQAVAALVEKSEVTAPASMVNKEIDYEMQNLDQRLQGMGLSLSQYIELTKMDMAQIRGQYKEQASARVKANLVIDEVVLKENIEVTDEEKEKELQETAKNYGVEDLEKFKEIFAKNVSDDTLVENIKRRKAVELLASKAKALPHEEYHKGVEKEAKKETKAKKEEKKED
ncbi:bacterial trigger factor protein (TF) domain protein, partial [Anaerococcus lactolyticus ATCC 51172]